MRGRRRVCRRCSLLRHLGNGRPTSASANEATGGWMWLSFVRGWSPWVAIRSASSPDLRTELPATLACRITGCLARIDYRSLGLADVHLVASGRMIFVPRCSGLADVKDDTAIAVSRNLRTAHTRIERIEQSWLVLCVAVGGVAYVGPRI